MSIKAKRRWVTAGLFISSLMILSPLLVKLSLMRSGVFGSLAPDVPATGEGSLATSINETLIMMSAAILASFSGIILLIVCMVFRSKIKKRERALSFGQTEVGQDLP